MAFWTNSAASESLSQISFQFLDRLFEQCPRRDFHVRLWDGSVWGSERKPRFTILLRHAGALRTMFLNATELSLGEAYLYDDFDVEGDIEAAFDLGDYLLGQTRGVSRNLELAEWLRRLPASHHDRGGEHEAHVRGFRHSRRRDRQAIRYHYDLPAEFYALWLDPQLLYSCAYFQSGEETLEAAQRDKLDYLCRKLRLQRGDRLLDIGCGWGALILHAAEFYGAQAVGITLSEAQAGVARKRIRERALTDQCRVEWWDYRDLKPSCQYDKIVSVGMFEHVGENLLPEYFRRAWDLLRPGGVFLNHGISHSATFKRRGPSFIERYVFPDGEIVPISMSLGAAEASGFEVRDVENLREHYVLTLREWLRRLEAHAEEAHRLTDDMTYRIWRLYMAGSAHGFEIGRMNLFQTLLTKPDHGVSRLPLTRSDWYERRGGIAEGYSPAKF